MGAAFPIGINSTITKIKPKPLCRKRVAIKLTADFCVVLHPAGCLLLLRSRQAKTPPALEILVRAVRSATALTHASVGLKPPRFKSR